MALDETIENSEEKLLECINYQTDLQKEISTVLRVPDKSVACFALRKVGCPCKRIDFETCELSKLLEARIKMYSSCYYKITQQCTMSYVDNSEEKKKRFRFAPKKASQSKSWNLHCGQVCFIPHSVTDQVLSKINKKACVAHESSSEVKL
ncbi:uncharacterized protein LOC126847920 [Adelges cooleyi]|uniref:uncharacterized protein LOC126847920 n=1 Tax=Adelges cooleyi TaxID=133065 RepID=UPI00217FB51A|nr:uncharacterized protein LOC126847920 [Adelges cooleyi]